MYVWCVRLDIQRDENEVLKITLQTMSRNKEDDIKMYEDLVEQNKNVFMQAMQQVRENSHEARMWSMSPFVGWVLVTTTELAVLW